MKMAVHHGAHVTSATKGTPQTVQGSIAGGGVVFNDLLAAMLGAGGTGVQAQPQLQSQLQPMLPGNTGAGPSGLKLADVRKSASQTAPADTVTHFLAGPKLIFSTLLKAGSDPSVKPAQTQAASLPKNGLGLLADKKKSGLSQAQFAIVKHLPEKSDEHVSSKSLLTNDKEVTLSTDTEVKPDSQAKKNVDASNIRTMVADVQTVNQKSSIHVNDGRQFETVPSQTDSGHTSKSDGADGGGSNNVLNATPFLLGNAGQMQGNVVSASVSSPQLDVRDPNALSQFGQLLSAKTDAGGTQLHVQVMPQGLGQLDVTVTKGPDGLQIQVIANQAQTYAWLNQQLPALQQTVQAAGVNVTNVQLSFGQSDGQTQGEGQKQRSSQQRRSSGITGLSGRVEKTTAASSVQKAAHRGDISLSV